MDGSTPFGRCWRMRPFMFSLLRARLRDPACDLASETEEQLSSKVTRPPPEATDDMGGLVTVYPAG